MLLIRRLIQIFQIFDWIWATCHATLDEEQLISHTRCALVDTFASLQGPNREVIPVSEVQELLTKIHDNQDNTVCKDVSHTAHILAYLFNAPSRHHHEVTSRQFPFLQRFNDIVYPSETCLYGHISWSLTQAQQKSSLIFPQFSTSVRCGKARPKACFQFNVQKWYGPDSIGTPLAKKPLWKLDFRVVMITGSHLCHASGSSTDSGKMGSYQGVPDVLQSTASSSSAV